MSDSKQSAQRKMRLVFRHGLRADLEKTKPLVGEPLYCEDTQELFIGTGDGVTQVNIKGPQGARGLTGETGPQGPRGYTGEPGRDGRDGERGPKGDQGLQGERGYTGERGPQGPAGRNGIDGKDGKSINIKGALDNSTLLPAVGEANDGYLIDGDLWIWALQNNRWENVGKIQGPQGAMGAKGERGLQGERGPQGDRGFQGVQGPIGPRGDKGDRGEKGDSPYDIAVRNGFHGTEKEWLISLKGATGPQGPAGIAGPQGLQGIRGERGLPGERGPQGPMGTIDTSQFYNKTEVDMKITEMTAGGTIDFSSYATKTYVTEVIDQIELIPGPKGEQGAAGIHIGETAPTDATCSLWLDTTGKPIQLKRIWRKHDNEQPIYSSPVITQLASNNQTVIVYQSWDGQAKIIDFATGEQLLAIDFEVELYGRPQCADINGDGLTEFFFATHSGEIRCYNEKGALLWTQYDEFHRQGVGTVSTYVADGVYSHITDRTKNWCDGFGVRNENVPEENAKIKIIAGTGAGQILPIRHVEWNEIYFYEEPAVPLDETSVYQIYPYSPSDYMFQHAGTLLQEADGWYLYVCGFDMCCRKINAATGEVIWVYSSKEAIEPYPYLADLDNDGIYECYFPSVDWYIYSLNSQTGRLNWKYATKSGNDAFLTSLTLSNGHQVLIASSRDGRVYYLNPDGTLHAKTTITNGDIDCRPIVGDFNQDGKQEIVFGGDAGFVYCCDENGETLWRYRNGSYINSSPQKADVNYDDKEEVIVCDMTGTLSIFDGLTGGVLYTLNARGSIEGTPAVGDFNQDELIEIVITTVDGYIELYQFAKEV